MPIEDENSLNCEACCFEVYKESSCEHQLLDRKHERVFHIISWIARMLDKTAAKTDQNDLPPTASSYFAISNIFERAVRV